MKRSRFLAIGALTVASLATAETTANSSAPSSLAAWIQGQSAQSYRAAGVLHIKARIPQAKLPRSLEKLAHLTDTHLRAGGNKLTGTCEGLPFELVLS